MQLKAWIVFLFGAYMRCYVDQKNNFPTQKFAELIFTTFLTQKAFCLSWSLIFRQFK